MIQLKPPLIFVDGAGASGGYLIYGVTIAIVGSAFIFFLYRWYTGSLDMDEEPKLQVFQEIEESHHDP